jgi:hypothetical protein
MLPTPAVMAIAAAPQNNTWAVPRSFGAPPTWAPKAPRPARQIKVVITTVGIILSLGAKMAAASGSDAATVNVSPEAIAACNGFAACTSDTPPTWGGILTSGTDRSRATPMLRMRVRQKANTEGPEVAVNGS